MATIINNDPHEIQMDSEPEDRSEMDTDEVHSSDVNSDESEDELVPKEQSANRNWGRTVFEPHLFHFDAQNSGVSTNAISMKSDTAFDFFEFLFDEKLTDIIVEETNKYQVISTNDMTHDIASHQAKRTPINLSEMYTFLATIMLMSVVEKNTIHDYWSADPLIVTPMFRQLFSRDRFLMLLKYLHFNGNSNQVVGDGLYKIKPVIHELRKKFRLFVVPYKNLCTDESLAL